MRESTAELDVQPRPSTLPFFVRRFGFYSMVSALVGVGISLLISFAMGITPGLATLVAGAVIGVSINTVIFTFEIVLLRTSALLTGSTVHSSEVEGTLLRFGRIAVYFAGGVVGFLIGTRINDAVFGGDPLDFSGPVLGWVLFMGIFSIVVGSIIFAHESMRERLRQSVAQLKEQEFARKELELARSIQQRLLPAQEILGRGFLVAARNRAARFVAGDFYDVFRLDGGDLGLVVADVAGKGMGASLIMASVKAMLPLVAAEHPVAETLDSLNRRLAADLSSREFVALAYARYSPTTGRLELGNAGLPDPIVVSGDGTARPLVVAGERLPLAARRATSYETATVSLTPGDRLVMFTDGLAERRTAAGEVLGYEELPRLFPARELAPGPWLDALFERLAALGDAGGLEDDWTALVLEVSGSDRGPSEGEGEEVVGINEPVGQLEIRSS